MRALVLATLLVGCAEPAADVTADPVAQCFAIFDAFCTEASTCQRTPNPTTADDVAQCYALADAKCESNRTVISPLAFELCLRSIAESGCDEQGFRASSGAMACLAFVDSW